MANLTKNGKQVLTGVFPSIDGLRNFKLWNRK